MTHAVNDDCRWTKERAEEEAIKRYLGVSPYPVSHSHATPSIEIVQGRRIDASFCQAGGAVDTSRADFVVNKKAGRTPPP